MLTLKPARPRPRTRDLTDGECWTIALEYREITGSRARWFAGRGVERDDLLQEGMLGLYRAAKSFDPALGIPFQTYATWWVDQRMRLAIANLHHPVRIPRHVQKLAKKLRTGVISEGDLTPGQRRCVAAALAIRKAAMKRADRLGCLTDVLDRSGKSPFDRVLASDLPDRVAEVLARLPARERFVVESRFGLDAGRTEKPFAEIGRAVGLGYEWTRKIHAGAIEKLRKRLGVAS